jgi:hypothetical protein
MPLILRKIRKSKWYKHANVGWLPDGEVQADALGDLKTEENALSVWWLDDNKSNLNDLVAALASKCDTVANLDYALLDIDILSSLGIKLVETDGDSLHRDANDSWHRDLVELSASKLLALASAIASSGETKRIYPNVIIPLIASSVKAGQIDKDKLQAKVRTKIESFL